MKAKVIKTGEIVEVVPSGKYFGQVEDAYSKRHWSFNEIEPIPDNVQKEKIIDWEQRRYELANSAMQGLLINPKVLEICDAGIQVAKKLGKEIEATDFYAGMAISYADAVIEKLKEQ